ncbi:MAG: DUF4358 domain-containing protein [Oscillospiraceae bacterium]
MKKVLALILSAIFVFSLTACTKKEKNPATSEIMAKVKQEITLPETADISKENIDSYIASLKSDDITELSYVMAGDGISPDEVFIAKFNDDVDMEKVKGALETYKENKVSLFENYSADTYKIKDSQIIIKGKYAFFAMVEDNKAATKIFTDFM